MIIFLTIIIALTIASLLVVTAMQPAKSGLSHYELTRRSHKGHQTAKNTLDKEIVRGDLLSLQRVILTTLILLITVISIVAYGWVWGIVLSLIVIVMHGAVARLSFVIGLADKLFQRIDSTLLRFIKRAPWFFALIRLPHVSGVDDIVLGSREELEHLVHESSDILSPQEKALIVHGLQFSDKQVKSVMVPRSMIDSIKGSELLGPLVLSELHDLGHSRLPVITKDIDHVIGILHIRDLLTLDDKKTVTADKAMEKKVFYIHEDDLLEHALGAFLKTRHHLFIVINEFRETVGLLTIEDVIEALLGRRIVDENNVNHDVRSAAAQNPKQNNQTHHGHDI